MNAPRGWFAGVMLVAALVGAAGCKEVQEPEVAPPGGPGDSADQIIFGARQLLTDQGLLRARLQSDTAYFLNEGTRIELRIVNTEFFNTTGVKTATLTSREGTYNTQLGQMSARKNVLVVSEDGRRLTTQEVRFNERTNLISSDSAFVVTQGNRRLEGVGFETDPNMNSVRCKAACRGELGAVAVPQTAGSGAPAGAPPPRGSRPNTFVLPGQPGGPPPVPPADTAAALQPAPRAGTAPATPPAVPPARPATQPSGQPATPPPGAPPTGSPPEQW